MPELPEVESVRLDLLPAMEGARIESVVTNRADLRTAFPPDFADRLEGQTVRALTRRGKYLLAELSSSEILVMHLGMSGSFRVENNGRATADPYYYARDASARHDHVVFRMSSGATVVFNDPRRFGFMDLARTDRLDRHPALKGLGPEPLSEAFDAGALARACAGKRTPLKSALLDQQVVAGLGNIYAVEALHIAGLSPQRQASTIATAGGEPRDSARALASAIKQVLAEAIDRQTSARYRAGRFRVYDREREPCRRPRCRGVIRRRTQAGRSTFYCPVCQR